MTSLALSPASFSPAADALSDIQNALVDRIGADRFDMWFDRKTTFRLEGSRLIVVASNAFAADWIRSKFIDDLRQATAQVLECPADISIEVESRVRPAEEVSGADDAPAALPLRLPPGFKPVSVLNPKHTLEDFVVGPSNQLAYQAAVRVAANPGAEFNPLFIHGSCGLGKTHLLQGICQRFSKLHPGKKWLYLTGEQFTNEFLESIRAHKAEAFRKKIRGAELLIIDDIHFLANKKATQEEFLHTFNQIDTTGRQVVLASDCAPRQIAAMADSLVSRFVSGMVVRVDSPDLPTRLEILRRRAARNAWQLSDAVLMHIAQQPAASVRELEGLLLQVVAGMTLVASEPSDRASSIIANLKQRAVAAPAPVPVETIVERSAEYFGLTPGALLGSQREKVACTARAVAMFLARRHTGMSFPEIGRAMGNKNHSTVIAACQRVETQVNSGQLVCWKLKDEHRHKSMPDVLHALEAAIRRGR